MKKAICLLLALAACSAHGSEISEIFRELKGYTVVDVFKITGWVDPSGKKGEYFEGCEYGRTIIFNDSKGLKCRSLGLQLALRPDAIVLVKDSSFKMIVNDRVYEMSNL